MQFIHRGEAVLRKHLRTFEENQIICGNLNAMQFIHRGEAVLRKHFRTFEENQINNIIRREPRVKRH